MNGQYCVPEGEVVLPWCDGCGRYPLEIRVYVGLSLELLPVGCLVCD